MFQNCGFFNSSSSKVFELSFLPFLCEYEVQLMLGSDIVSAGYKL